MSKSKRRNRSRHSGQRRHSPTAGSTRPPSENLVGPGDPDDRTQAMAITEVMMAHRHKATGHGPAQPDDPAKVRIAVVTGPGPEVSLRKEIRLCKAALLYGDAVTLYSPNALMLASVERLGNATGDERFELLRALYPIVEPDAGPAILDPLDQLMGLRTRRRRTREQLQLVLQLEHMLNRQWHGIEETAAQLRSSDAGCYSAGTASWSSSRRGIRILRVSQGHSGRDQRSACRRRGLRRSRA
jgi:hypothetical protein